MEFNQGKLTKAQLNRFRFEILQDLAKGKITAQDAKHLCGMNNAICQNAVFVASKDHGYLRLEGNVSVLSH